MIPPDEVVKAVRWKLGLPVGQDVRPSRERWAEFAKDPAHRERAAEICHSLAGLLEQVFQYKLDLLADHVATEQDAEFLNSLWDCFVAWLRADDTRRLRHVLETIASRAIRNALETTLSDASQESQALETGAQETTVAPGRDAERPPEARHEGSGTALSASPEQIAPPSPGTQQADKAAAPASGTPAPTGGSLHPIGDAEGQPARKADGPPPATATWKYLPVPDEPDKHEECDSRAAEAPEELKLIGARVRGKKHKHEGTNCDDWFEFAVSGPWTIIAVSDGAGSKKFSRVGARVACTAAVQHLAATLLDHRIRPRDPWSSDTFKRDERDGAFAEEDLEVVQEALHRAMLVAYDAVEAAAIARRDSAEHRRILGHSRVDIKDLSGTLLLVVHTTVQYKDTDYSLALACQVGDGIVAAVDHTGALHLLGMPDSGDFAGETDFLTSKAKLERAHLMRKTFPFFSPMRALMVMTDGVADDYFPNDPGLLRLYGDLVLNHVLDIRGPSDSDMASALSQTNLPTLGAAEQTELHSLVETITATGPRQVPIRSVAVYAEKLGVPLAEVVASPALLLAGSRGEPMCSESSPEDTLQVWLDSYQVRGSFDDRTLVVLYREFGP